MSDIDPIENEMTEVASIGEADVVLETAVTPHTPLVIQPDEEPALEPGTSKQRAILFFVGGIILILDQISKWWVEANIPLYQTWEPFPAQSELFRFTHVPNTGVAFGMFQNGGAIFAVVAIVVSLIIIYYNYTLPKGNLLLRFALGLQIGGALGNFTDRIRIGHVTDFLDFGPVPIFNVADTAVVTGAIILGIVVLLETREEKAKADAARHAAFAASNAVPVVAMPMPDADLNTPMQEHERSESTNEHTLTSEPVDESETHDEQSTP